MKGCPRKSRRKKKKRDINNNKRGFAFIKTDDLKDQKTKNLLNFSSCIHNAKHN